MGKGRNRGGGHAFLAGSLLPGKMRRNLKFPGTTREGSGFHAT